MMSGRLQVTQMMVVCTAPLVAAPTLCFQKCNSSSLFCTLSPLFIVTSLLINFSACPLCDLLCHICRQLFATFLKTRSRAIP